MASARLSFGTYAGKTLEEVARESPLYLLWIAGVKTKYSMKEKSIALYADICKEYPHDVEAAKAFIQDKCWDKVSSGSKHFCKRMQFGNHYYHFHPYGKRS